MGSTRSPSHQVRSGTIGPAWGAAAVRVIFRFFFRNPPRKLSTNIVAEGQVEF